ncbi:MAG: DUF493 domain-containing protein [Acidithiobacillus sp.]|nr:DUF493 domain-containing protein [Acidithiobacillus sp.]
MIPDTPDPDFPHLHHLKAIGQHEDLLQAVREAIDPLAPGLEPGAFQLRESRQGRYAAVTCSLVVENPEQLQAIYAAIQKIEGVLLCL